MPEEVKFNEEEMKRVNEIRKEYVSIQQKFGQLKLSQLVLDKNHKLIEDELSKLQSSEEKFLDGITEKYGDGTLNPETGVFTPNPSENKS